eukprot:m.298957 g.298957  ORF g.298957 m.298957 type:complete len:276 (+) comp13999_c0_seq1:55-882(+)
MADLRELIDRMTLGVVQSLERRIGVVEVRTRERPAASTVDIGVWEKTQKARLPQDLRQFLLTCSGFDLEWTALFADRIITLGRLHVHSLKSLARIPAGEADSDTGGDGALRETLDQDVVVIEQLQDGALIAVELLPFEEDASALPRGRVWLRDRSQAWHVITQSFSDYFRLMALHLGIIGWQYAFTPIGLSPRTKQWFHLYAPVRLRMDQREPSASVIPSVPRPAPPKLNIGKILRKVNEHSMAASSPQASSRKTNTLGRSSMAKRTSQGKSSKA